MYILLNMILFTILLHLFINSLIILWIYNADGDIHPFFILIVNVTTWVAVSVPLAGYIEDSINKLFEPYERNTNKDK